MIRTKIIAALCALGFSISAHAISFDVTSLTGGNNGIGVSATGTSGSVGWSIDNFSTWLTNTTVDGSYTGFSGANFTPALAQSDRLHTFGTNMTIVFDQNITSILFYLRENGGNSTLDFGLTPTLVSGDVVINGTSVTGLTTGGVVRFSGLNTNILSSVTTLYDGMDSAWVVESVSASSVPDAGSTVLSLGFGLLGLAAIGRKFARR